MLRPTRRTKAGGRVPSLSSSSTLSSGGDPSRQLHEKSSSGHVRSSSSASDYSQSGSESSTTTTRRDTLDGGSAISIAMETGASIAARPVNSNTASKHTSADTSLLNLNVEEPPSLLSSSQNHGSPSNRFNRTLTLISQRLSPSSSSASSPYGRFHSTTGTDDSQQKTRRKYSRHYLSLWLQRTMLRLQIPGSSRVGKCLTVIASLKFVAVIAIVCCYHLSFRSSRPTIVSSENGLATSTTAMSAAMWTADSQTRLISVRGGEIDRSFRSDFAVTFANQPTGTSGRSVGMRFPHKSLHHSIEPDYGDLDIYFFAKDDGPTFTSKRIIHHDYVLDEGKEDRRRPVDDNVDYYYALDDDGNRNTYEAYHDDQIASERLCRRTSWHRDVLINCNSFHELDLQRRTFENKFHYLSHGGYRSVFIVDMDDDEGVTSVNSDGTRVIIYKSIRFDVKYQTNKYETMRKDSLVAEKLSSSPMIVDVYGFCALGHLGEAMPNGDLEDASVPTGGEGVELEDSEDLDPQNNFTAEQKLQFALEMAKSISLLHSYSGGVIVHDDIQLSQFLFTADGHLKLNDFNRAEPMLWDEENQEYCRYRNGHGQGNWRSPEEYFDHPLNEKIDVFSFGNNLHAVLTGLYPFNEAPNSKWTKEQVKKGIKPEIDPRWKTRSYIEGKLVELIERCWEFNPDDRISMFEAVEFLEQVAEENNQSSSND